MAKEGEPSHRIRLTTWEEFDVNPGQCLILNLGTPIGIDHGVKGLDRVVITIGEDGSAHVRAHGYSPFQFGKAIDPESGVSDFLIENPSLKVRVEDYFLTRFWGQFTLGELAKLQDQHINSKLRRKIRRRLAQFEEDLAGDLNSASEVQKIPRFKNWSKPSSR